MDLLLVLIIIVLLMWCGGFALGVGGSLIHLLLVLFVILILVKLLTGRQVL